MNDLKAFLDGFVLAPKGGRPRKTERDLAVFLATQWFAAGSPDGAKVQASVVDLWARRGFDGISETAHVRARIRSVLPIVRGCCGTLLVFKGTTGALEDAGTILADEATAQYTEAGALHRLDGELWAWQYGDELAQRFAGAADLKL